MAILLALTFRGFREILSPEDQISPSGRNDVAHWIPFFNGMTERGRNDRKGDGMTRPGGRLKLCLGLTMADSKTGPPYSGRYCDTYRKSSKTILPR